MGVLKLSIDVLDYFFTFTFGAFMIEMVWQVALHSLLVSEGIYDIPGAIATFKPNVDKYRLIYKVMVGFINHFVL